MSTQHIRNTMGYPANDQGGERPMMWVPGLIYLDGEGHILRGADVGYSTDASTLRGLALGYRRSMTDWMHAAWVVERSALTRDIVADHAIVEPETMLDHEDMPSAHRWLREQPLVCVSAATWARLAAEGLRVYRIAFNVTGEGRLHIDQRGGDAPRSSLAVSLETLYRGADMWEGRPWASMPDGAASPVDRLLRFISKGALGEASVMNAFDARRIIEYGYGYRGAVEGRFLSAEAIARRLRPTDMLFDQVFARAKRMRPDAMVLDQALGAAAEGDDEITVPVYGSARRVIDRPLPVSGLDRLLLDGETLRSLELPEETRWQVDSIDTWRPRPQMQLIPTGPEARLSSF